MFYFETASFGNPAIFICLSIVKLSQQAERQGDLMSKTVTFFTTLMKRK